MIHILHSLYIYFTDDKMEFSTKNQQYILFKKIFFFHGSINLGIYKKCHHIKFPPTWEKILNWSHFS